MQMIVPMNCEDKSQNRHKEKYGKIKRERERQKEERDEKTKNYAQNGKNQKNSANDKYMYALHTMQCFVYSR